MTTHESPQDQEPIRTEARQQAGRHLWRLLYEAGCRPDDWNGGDVVPVVEQWLIDQGVDTERAPLTEAQEGSLQAICGRYNVGYDPGHYRPTFDLPEGYVAGFVGGQAIQEQHQTIYVGCDPEGRISS